MERIRNAVDKIVERAPLVRGKGEEATKQSLVLPLLDALGYDIWNPAEVCPEYEADFATKKLGQKEKVDLAVLIQATPRIYIEVKPIDFSLDGHEGQLARYFNATTSVSLGLLTNGLEYRFFSDTAEANIMDSKPFHVCRFDALDQGLEVLIRFQRSVFSAEAIRDYARELNYTARIVGALREQLDLRDREPSEDLVRWILSKEQIYDRRVTASVVEAFSPIVKNALQIVLRDIVRRSISALDNEVSAPAKGPDISQPQAEEVPALEAASDDATSPQGLAAKAQIQTTEEELECFAVVKELFEASALASAKIRDVASKQEIPIQVAYKDTTGYFSIYLNRPTWWGLRIVLGGRTKWAGFNIDSALGESLLPPAVRRLDPSPWAEFRVAFDKPQDLYGLSRLVHAVFKQIIDDRSKVTQFPN